MSSLRLPTALQRCSFVVARRGIQTSSLASTFNSSATHSTKNDHTEGVVEKVKKEFKETFSDELPGPAITRKLHDEPHRDRQNELAEKYPDDFSQGARGFEEVPPYNPGYTRVRQTLSEAKDKIRQKITGEKDLPA